VSVDDVFAREHGLATSVELSKIMSRRDIARHVRAGVMVRVCHGVYAQAPPDLMGRLAAQELMVGRALVPCLSTAAWLYGFDTERDSRLHVLDAGTRMRPARDVVVHQRAGAPLCRIDGRLVTAPAWTAIEVARTLRRPRALATLDAALRAGGCTVDEMRVVVKEHAGRRGIVRVRELLDYADGRAESPMESEARLLFIDYGLPEPELQYWIVDLRGDRWRVDFAWPDAHVVAEYDSLEWHANPQTWKRDRIKVERLKECHWTTVPMVVDDIRVHPYELANRVGRLLGSPQ
jgi:Transcriptional regulator, AbiEi antitoxin